MFVCMWPGVAPTQLRRGRVEKGLSGSECKLREYVSPGSVSLSDVCGSEERGEPCFPYVAFAAATRAKVDLGEPTL